MTNTDQRVNIMKTIDAENVALKLERMWLELEQSQAYKDADELKKIIKAIRKWQGKQ